MAHMYKSVVSVISKSPIERTNAEIERIIPWFKKKSDLFQSLQPEIVNDIIKNCQFECLSGDQVVLQQGDIGDSFYIILNGHVSIYIDTAISEAEAAVAFQTLQKQLSRGSSIVELAADNPAKICKLDKTKYGSYIGIIEAGKSFGELALISKDCVRNATIITEGATDLLVVHNDLYDRSLRAHQELEFLERQRFVNDCAMFHSWSIRHKRQMAMSLRQDTLSFDDVLVKQGNPVEEIYFLLRGQVKLVIDHRFQMTQFSEWFPVAGYRSLLRSISGKHEEDSACQSAASAEGFAEAYNTHSERRTELCTMGPIDVIGDVEMSLGLPSFVQTVTCTQRTTVYALDMKNYDRLITRKNPKTLNLLREMTETKLSYHCSRLPQGKLPLLKCLLFKLKKLTTPDDNTPEATGMKNSSSFRKKCDFSQGPIIDLYGPGTVFYRIRMRDKAKQKAKQKTKAFAGRTWDEAITPNGLRNDKPTHVKLRSRDYELRLSKSQDVFVDNLHKYILSDINNDAKCNSQEINNPDPIISDCSDAEYSDDKSSTQSTNNVNNVNTLYETGMPSVIPGGSTESLIPRDDLYGWESSDRALCELEGRIRAWHSTMGDNVEVDRQTDRLHKLHRLQIAPETKPWPGVKVFIRKRSRQRAVGFQHPVPKEGKEEHQETQTSMRRPTTSAGSSRYSEVSSYFMSYGIETEMSSDDRPVSRVRVFGACRPATSAGEYGKKRHKQYSIAEYKAMKQALIFKQKSFEVKLFTQTLCSIKQERNKFH